MRYPLIIIGLVMSCQLVLADKPDWAGEGGKPSTHDIENHREDMQDKGKGNKNKNKNKNKKDSDDIEDELRDRVADEIDDAIRGKK